MIGLMPPRPGLDFALPHELAAHEPPEVRGIARDAIRLMVSRVADDAITHTRFFHFADFLAPNDVLVVNASATINAALDAVREAADGSARNIALHLSAPLEGARWVVELRRRAANGTTPLLNAKAGERLSLAAGGTAQLVAPYVPGASDVPRNGRVRLWVATLTLPEAPLAYTARHGSPIRYAYVPKAWPLPYYQTVFANEPGSAEMPSAGRAFTPEVLERLAHRGVRIAPVILHAGVGSLEADESPYPERYRVSDATADAVNRARALGGRVVAVGTTVVRALESVVSDDGRVGSGQGWTDLVITPERRLRAADAMLTGLHQPNASHLSVLTAFAGRDHIALAYQAALDNGYLWHEFGDVHLILR
jgi:S-adenosylmethionine:tRNA ribosyltransferase-isomerase